MAEAQAMLGATVGAGGVNLALGASASGLTKSRQLMLAGTIVIGYLIALGGLAAYEYSRPYPGEYLSPGTWVILTGAATGATVLWWWFNWEVDGIGSVGPMLMTAFNGLSLAYFCVLDAKAFTVPGEFQTQFARTVAGPAVAGALAVMHLLSTIVAQHGGIYKSVKGARLLKTIAGHIGLIKFGRLGFDGSANPDGVEIFSIAAQRLQLPPPCLRCIYEVNEGIQGVTTGDYIRTASVGNRALMSQGNLGYCTEEHRRADEPRRAVTATRYEKQYAAARMRNL